MFLALVFLIGVGCAFDSRTELGAVEPDRPFVPMSALDPILTDTIIRDTIIPLLVSPPDQIPPDSLRELLTPPTDTIVGPEMEEVRQVPPRNVPVARGGRPANPEAGVWEFDLEAIMATHAMTLHDLLSLVPGIVMLRGGDYGNPVAVTTSGLGPGQVRVFRDGVEDPPMEGGVLDLAQVGLAGLESVRVERRPGELRIHLESLRISDPRAYTYLDVSTGDLRTNTFRATFAHPDALGGTLLVALDRMDTDGPFRDEPGASYGTHLRYALFPRPDRGIAFHYRSRTAQRPPGFFTPVDVNRTDLGFRGGWDVNERVTLEAFGNRTTIEPGREAAEGADTLLPADARGLLGVRASGSWNDLWVRGEARAQSGAGWPSSVLGLEAGGRLEGLGGASVSVETDRWDGGEAGRSVGAAAWTEPRWGLSAFAEVQDARRGVPFFIPPVLPDENGEDDGDPDGDGNGTDPEPGNGDEDDVVPPGTAADLLRFGERRGIRAGVRGRLAGLDLTAALLRVEADSLFPMGLPFDRQGEVVEGGERAGFEVEARIPLTPIREGLSISGHAQFWEDAPGWRYAPDRSWMGSINWHHVGYDSNLEIWFDVGARGRDLMPLPFAGPDGTLQTAPSSLSWFGRLQFRVVTVRVFAHWENFTVRDDLADFPNRVLPPTRAVYGIRWVMWN